MKTALMILLLILSASQASGQQVRRMTAQQHQQGRMAAKAKIDHQVWAIGKFGDLRIYKNQQAYKKYMAEEAKKKKQQRLKNTKPGLVKGSKP